MPRAELHILEMDRLHCRLAYPDYTGVALSWDTTNKLVYESMYHGLGIVDPVAGKRIALVNGFARAKYDMETVGIPSGDGGSLYLLHTNGTSWALRHPELQSSKTTSALPTSNPQ
jgi:hypothetical protein